MHKTVLTALMSVGAAVYVSGAALAEGEPAKPSPVAASVIKTASVVTTAPAPKLYTVQTGDSLSAIATTEGLASWQPLWDANPDLSNPDVIYPGQELTVPDGPTTPRSLPNSVVSAPVTNVAPGGGNTGSYHSQAPARPAASAPGYTGNVDGILARTRQRESGGNYATNTGNGYYGAYQFDLSTWRGVGGQGLPSNASPAEQDMRAQMLYNERGCSPWPNTCH